MEITFSQNLNYSLDLQAKQVRELADRLDITVKELKRLAEEGELYDEHGDGLVAYVNDNIEKAEIAEHDDIEIDEITP